MIEFNNELSSEMLSNQYISNWNTLIYLLCCSIHGEIPDTAKINVMKLEEIYWLAKSQSLQAMCCMALERTDIFSKCENALVKKWMDEKNKSIRKNLMMDAERQTICDYMEQNEIWYLPLKGIILKDYYPKAGMRQMADNDILYDADYQKQLKMYMISLGYKAKSVGKGNHDVYTKLPVYNFEMHTSLYGKGIQSGWDIYYNEIRKRLIRDSDKKYSYHMREEDFYVYIISHAFKHYDGSGTGLRSLVDMYMYLKQMESKLNWNYISMELETLKLTEFEKKCKQLCKKLLSIHVIDLTNTEENIVMFMMKSGTYGTMKINVANKLHKYQPDNQIISASTRIRYLLKRVFPSNEWYNNNMPFAGRHKWFRPFYIVFRIIRGVIKNGGKIIRETKIVVKMK